MRNPKWHRDEIILTLDLYFSEGSKVLDNTNPKVIELSKTLNNLPLFPNRPDKERFRNPNGVALKMANFLYFEKGKGMSSGSKLDKVVLEEFYSERSRLRRIASEIRKVANNSELNIEIASIEEDEFTEADSVKEGITLYKLHKYRERNNKIVLQKKKKAWSDFGKLSCEACLFDFEYFYGAIGNGFMECHHLTPLSVIQVETITKLEDLALVCSNCHRMLHKRIDTISVKDLKLMIKYDRI